MNHTLQRLMRATAARLTQNGRWKETSETLQRSLSDALDGAFGTGTGTGGAFRQPMRQAPAAPPAGVATPAPDRDPGEFRRGTHTHGALTRDYKLYIPPGSAGRPSPLVVMLHGCTQDPDDFAAGTAMNLRADEQGFCVLYPAQAQDANPARCWNWFKHNHQQRDRGEAALIADLTLAMVRQQGLDLRRVFIAGLSAGGAMATAVAAAYPEIFRAVGVHSGLAPGAASNLPQALSAMRQGGAGAGAATPRQAVPTIVFHGDQDTTVHPRNGEQVIASALAGAPGDGGSPKVEQGVSAGGRRYTRSIHRDAQGRACAEHWLVEGAGHAWSGGHPAGTYTDASGPDATREMLRFFFEPHPE